MSDSHDIVVLSIPRGVHVLPVMRVLIGGVASHYGLALDSLDDLQLAVETLLAEEPRSGCDLRLELRGRTDRLSVCLHGLSNQSVKAALVAAGPFQPCAGCLLDVRLLLSSLVGEYQVREGTAESYSVEMEKRAS